MHCGPTLRVKRSPCVSLINPGAFELEAITEGKNKEGIEAGNNRGLPNLQLSHIRYFLTSRNVRANIYRMKVDECLYLASLPVSSAQTLHSVLEGRHFWVVLEHVQMIFMA